MARPIPTTEAFAARFWSKVDTSAGCWLWTGALDHKGYGKVGDSRSGKMRTRTASRVAWELACGPIPEGKAICHRCDNPPCCRPSHLFVGSVADNNADRDAKGRRVGPSKLTAEQVTEIRRRYRPRVVTLARLAEEYGVTFQAISHVVNRSTWRHVA